MTLSKGSLLKQIKEYLKDIGTSETQEVSQEFVQQIQQELLEERKLLLETKKELSKEQQRNLELTNNLQQANEKLQSLPLKRVPSYEETLKYKYPCFLDDIIDAPCPQKRLKICIVTQDIIGPIRNGGIGTAFYYAANFLQDCGHDVTILYSLGDYCETENIETWIDYYAEKNIKFVPAPEPIIPSTKDAIGRNMFIARKVYEYLKNQHFDIVHVSEWQGNAFYALLAKKLGLAFAKKTFCIKTSSPTLWGQIGNNYLVDNPDKLLTSYIERKSVEWGDIIIAPSRHMLSWMESHGYDIPKEKCYVQPNIMPISQDWTEVQGQERTYLKEVKELVFFGRLVPRKGIEIFCKALTKLEKEGGINCKVVFLGKFNPVGFDAETFLREQAKNWSFEWEMITSYNALEAMAYLKENNGLAVVPSLLDNSPFTIYECLSERIPFICSDRGGTPELVCQEDSSSVVIPAHPTKLAHRIRQVLDEGVVIARPAFDFQKNLDYWQQWHLAIAHNPQLRLERSETLIDNKNTKSLEVKNTNPLVSICIAHFNRPYQLSQAIESVKHQTYNNYEVIIVDDGSDDPEAIAYLDSLEEDFARRGWRIVRQENLYLGAVRNTSVRHAKGEYVLFMDDDNCAKAHELTTFVNAAIHSNADILTCFADLFEGGEAPHPDKIKSRITPVGDCMGYGLLANCYGDSNSLVKRSFFEEIGGFSEDYGVGLDDMEFFSKAILKGGKLLVIPEALFWYRTSGERMTNVTNINAGKWRAFRPFMESVPWVAHDSLRLVLGLFMTYNRTKEKVRMIEKLSKTAETNFEKLNFLIGSQNLNQ